MLRRTDPKHTPDGPSPPLESWSVSGCGARREDADCLQMLWIAFLVCGTRSDRCLRPCNRRAFGRFGLLRKDSARPSCSVLLATRCKAQFPHRGAKARRRGIEHRHSTGLWLSQLRLPHHDRRGLLGIREPRSPGSGDGSVAPKRVVTMPPS